MLGKVAFRPMGVRRLRKLGVRRRGGEKNHVQVERHCEIVAPGSSCLCEATRREGRGTVAVRCSVAARGVRMRQAKVLQRWKEE